MKEKTGKRTCWLVLLFVLFFAASCGPAASAGKVPKCQVELSEDRELSFYCPEGWEYEASREESLEGDSSP